MRLRVYQHAAGLDFEVVRGDHVVEGRRRAARLGPVLVAMPRAGDAPVDNPPLAERAVLVAADVGDAAQLVPVAEYRDPLAPHDRDARAALGGLSAGAARRSLSPATRCSPMTSAAPAPSRSGIAGPGSACIAPRATWPTRSA